MSDNLLSPGFAGPVAPRPADADANPMQASPDQAPPTAASPMMQHFGSAQDVAAARYAKMKEATAKLAATRKELDGLTALGDTVSQEDVIKAASGMVAAGIGAPAVAGILADMPEGGAALQGWIAEHDAAVRQREAQAQQALTITRHEMGVAALRHIIAHSSEGMGQAPPAAGPQMSAPQSLAPTTLQ